MGWRVHSGCNSFMAMVGEVSNQLDRANLEVFVVLA